MNKLESAFQELESLNSLEMNNVVGGFVSIDVMLEAKKTTKSKDVATTTNTGWFCGINVNLCK